MEITKKQNILLQWIFWQFFEVPRNILRAWRNFLNFGLYYFSTPLLIRTFFAHWRRYYWPYPKGFDLAQYLEAFVSNLISRTIGAILRSFLIIIGILVEIFIFFIGFFIFLGWFILPTFLFWGIYHGFRLLF